MAVTKPAVGSFAVGTSAVAGESTFDAPTVSVTAPTSEQVIGTGGPNLTVSWNYSQAQSKTQSHYRIIFTDDAGAVTHYDTGWVASAVATTPVDLVANGVPTDSTDISVQVWVRATGVGPHGVSGLRPFQMEWGVVTATLLTPADLEIVTSSALTPTWSFASTRSKTQTHYRLQLRTATSMIILEDTGWVADTTATSKAFVYPLADGSSYTVGITLRNSEGVESAEDTATISASLSAATSFTDLDSVGEIYECAINGVGYMLFDNRIATPFGQFQYDRRTLQLDAPRLATSETPFAEAIERYNFGTANDWTGGRGQTYADRDESSRSAFLESEGVDVFTAGQLELLNDMDEAYDTTQTDLLVVAVGTDFYRLENGDDMAQSTDVGATFGSVFQVHDVDTPTIVDLASDGAYWYACDGLNVYRNNTAAASTGAAWSLIDIEVIEWAGDRICGAYATSPATVPNTFTTLSDDGTEEVANGRIVLEFDDEINDITSLGGWVYFSVFRGDVGLIYAWNIGTSDTPFVALELPRGELPVAILGYQGQVILMSKRATGAATFQASLWRCVQNETSGTLTPFLVDEICGCPAGSLAARGDKVFFSWDQQDGTNAGIGILDLATGGYSKGYQTADDGPGSSLIVVQNRLVTAIGGKGIWAEQTDYVLTGFVRSSIYDGATTLSKLWSIIAITGQPLSTGESWTVKTSIDNGDSYTALAGAGLSTVGQFHAEADLDKQAQSLGIELTLVGDGTSTPTLTVTSGRYISLGLADELLVLPVNCADNVAALTGAPLEENGPGKGALRARTLQDLVQTRCAVQDIDWHLTTVTETFVLEAVQIRKWLLYDRQQGQATIFEVAICQFRRNQK